MSEQLAIEFARTHSRATDPVTSREAAASMAISSEAQRERVYYSLLRAGMPLTADDIAVREAMTIEQVCRRLPELCDAQRDGRVVRLEETRKTRTGRAAHLYRLRRVGEG